MFLAPRDHHMAGMLSAFELMDTADFFAPSSYRSWAQPSRRASSCCRTAAAYPYSVHQRHRPALVLPSPPPLEPEVHIQRADGGVIATCPLGRVFGHQDIR